MERVPYDKPRPIWRIKRITYQQEVLGLFVSASLLTIADYAFLYDIYAVGVLNTHKKDSLILTLKMQY